MIFFDRRCVVFKILIMIKLYYLFNIIEKKKYFIICLGFFFVINDVWMFSIFGGEIFREIG